MALDLETDDRELLMTASKWAELPLLSDMPLPFELVRSWETSDA